MEIRDIERLGHLAGIAFGAQGQEDMSAGARVLAQGVMAGCEEGAVVLASAISDSMQASARGLGVARGNENDPLVVESSRRQQSRDRTVLEQVFPGQGWGGAVAAFGQARYIASLLGASPEQRELAGVGAGLGFMVGGPVGALVGGLLGGLFGGRSKRREEEMRRAFWNTPEGMEMQAYLYNITQAMGQWGWPSFAPVYAFGPGGRLTEGYARAYRTPTGAGAGAGYLSVTEYAGAIQQWASGRGWSLSARPTVTVQNVEVNVRAESAQAGREAARVLWREFCQFAELDAPLTGLVEV